MLERSLKLTSFSHFGPLLLSEQFRNMTDELTKIIVLVQHRPENAMKTRFIVDKTEGRGYILLRFFLQKDA